MSLCQVISPMQNQNPRYKTNPQTAGTKKSYVMQLWSVAHRYPPNSKRDNQVWIEDGLNPLQRRSGGGRCGNAWFERNPRRRPEKPRAWTWVKCVFHTLAFATQPSLADPKCRQASSPSHILSLASRCACWPAIIDGSQNKLLAHVLTWGL